MDFLDSPATKLKRFLGPVISILISVCLCVLFLAVINRTSADSLKKEQATLTRALENGAVHTYALTGRYPESLDALLSEYHITYDREKFVVEYVPNGANLLPSITVLPINAWKGGSS